MSGSDTEGDEVFGVERANRTQTASNVGRNKVGRPRKTVDHRDIEKLGIVSVPPNIKDVSDDELVYSTCLLYDNPHLFKNVFNLFRHMKSDRVSIRFEKGGIKMLTWDKECNSRIYVEIYGERMNTYYCEKVLDLEFSIENPRKRLQSLSKENTEIQFSTTRHYEKDFIEMTLRNETISLRNVDKIHVDLPEKIDWSVVDDVKKEKHYPVKFEMPFGMFKDTISDIHVMSPDKGKFTIEKVGLEPLQFNYKYRDNRGDHEAEFEDLGKINLISTVDDDYPFAAPIFVERLKLLAGALISKSIHISVDETEDLIFTMYLDQEEGVDKKPIFGTEKACIKVLTKLANKPSENM
jgi:hypothetical protein